VSVTALRGWPSRRDFGATDTTPMDLAVVPGAGSGIVVVPVNGSGFDAMALTNGVGRIAIPDNSAMGAVADRETQLLFVADGTAGLRIIDLSTPGGSRDDDHDGIDDRVLGTVDLHGARAQKVAVWRSRGGAVVAAIATGTGGLYVVQATPNDPNAFGSSAPLPRRQAALASS
jgi:hypothetical protein